MKQAKRKVEANNKTGKTRITMYLDSAILEAYRKHAETKGQGYQTLINDTLGAALYEERVDSPETLRRIIREELKIHGKQKLT
jgi:uncharacterized protein (DUF4415 family)